MNEAGKERRRGERGGGKGEVHIFLSASLHHPLPEESSAFCCVSSSFEYSTFHFVLRFSLWFHSRRHRTGAQVAFLQMKINCTWRFMHFFFSSDVSCWCVWWRQNTRVESACESDRSCTNLFCSTMMCAIVWNVGCISFGASESTDTDCNTQSSVEPCKM